MIKDHEIDYKIYGEEIQCVEIELDPNETVIAESGSFMMMEEGIDMSTIFGDGSKLTSIFWVLLVAEISTVAWRVRRRAWIARVPIIWECLLQS